MIYLGVDGVVREADYPMAGVRGIARELEDGYAGVDGVARQILWGTIQPELIERMEWSLDTLEVCTVDADGSLYETVLKKRLSASTDLDAAMEYGSVNVNADSRTLEVNCSEAGYVIFLYGQLRIILNSGRIVPSTYFSVLKDPTVSADYYLRFNWSGSSHLEGQYNLNCCGVHLLDEYVSGSASGSKTITPQSENCAVAAGILSGRGTTTARMTVNAVSIGGTTFLPEIIYGGGSQ